MAPSSDVSSTAVSNIAVWARTVPSMRRTTARKSVASTGVKNNPTRVANASGTVAGAFAKLTVAHTMLASVLFCARHGEKVPKVSIHSVEPLQPHELATLHDNDALDWAILNDLIFGEKWHTNCVKYDAPRIDSVDFALETDRI
ncbi:unnamed protein product, partial [Aphanomyces euteiches]